MVDQTTIDAIENQFQIHVPESVRLFYKYPAYAVFIHAHHETDVFMPPHLGELDPERPLITKTAYPMWMAIGESPHTGMLLMVQLDSHSPQVSWRYFNHSSEDYTFPNTFEDWLLTGTDDILRSTDACIECMKTSQPKDA